MLCVRAKDDASTLGCRQAVRHQTLTLTCVGSNPAIPAKYDPLAQSVEQLPFKQWVWSSNLQRVTKKADTHLGICFLAVWRFEKFNGTVRWTVPWHRLDDANSLPGALAPGQRISSGSLRTKGAVSKRQSAQIEELSLRTSPQTGVAIPPIFEQLRLKIGGFTPIREIATPVTSVTGSQ